tara:strand:+ start:75 stop:533 length:459 start_codon:yes stop_codon:yes gene_type:complete
VWDIVARMSNRPTITPKQSAFATFVAQGDNNTEAYRKAYNTAKMSEQVIRNSACKLAKNERVQEAIKSLKVENKAKTQAHEKLTNDWIVEQLQDEALNEKNPPATRVRALELLGKSGGLFDDSTHVTIEHRSPEDVEEELMEKLGVLFAIEA